MSQPQLTSRKTGRSQEQELSRTSRTAYLHRRSIEGTERMETRHSSDPQSNGNGRMRYARQDPPRPVDQEDDPESTDDEEPQVQGLKEFTKPERASLNQTLSHNDYVKILKGYRPQQMEDRWVLVCKKPNPITSRGSVHMHRSWTGYEDLRAEFFRLESAELEDPNAPYAVFDRLWYETDSERRGARDEDEAKATFVSLLRALVGVITIDRDQATVVQ